MKNRTAVIQLGLGALALGVCVAALGQAPVISSFSQNGVLVCTNLQPATVASVEWASSLAGPWQTNWAGLDAVTVTANGTIQVGVPMFYRVRGTNSAPDGMALIPAGSFTMGDSLDGDSYALPLHTVYVSGFYMDKYLVTKAMWDTVYQWGLTNGYSFDYAGSGKGSTHPVQTIDWYDMVKWCNARSQKEHRTRAYYTDAGLTVEYKTGQVAPYVNWNTGYRLPTEAEWEKAARGGASGHRFPWTDAETISWSRANYYAYPSSYSYDVNPTSGFNPAWTSGGYPYTTPVGSFAPNGYGLYDMAGNVWERCWDWYGLYGSAAQSDPRGPGSGSDRVLRGGSWADLAFDTRCAARGYDYPSYASYYSGFRCVRGF